MEGLIPANKHREDSNKKIIPPFQIIKEYNNI